MEVDAFYRPFMALIDLDHMLRAEIIELDLFVM
jgi:hypothetical protein